MSSRREPSVSIAATQSMSAGGTMRVLPLTVLASRSRSRFSSTAQRGMKLEVHRATSCPLPTVYERKAGLRHDGVPRVAGWLVPDELIFGQRAGESDRAGFI